MCDSDPPPKKKYLSISHTDYGPIWWQAWRKEWNRIVLTNLTVLFTAMRSYIVVGDEITVVNSLQLVNVSVIYAL